MRLAVNFQRVDPSRGGAETYVADLCGQLVRLGHQVDLYAESWREGVLPGEVRCIAVEAPGRTRMARTWNFARNSEAALRRASYDCTVGLINTWHHDVIIPQGGVRDVILGFAMFGYGLTFAWAERIRSSESALLPSGEGEPPVERWLILYARATEDERPDVEAGARAELNAWRRREAPPLEVETMDELSARIISEGEGWSPKEVALAMRCTPTLVRRVREANERNVETGKVEGSLEHAKALLARGCSLRQVAILTGIPKSTLADQLKRAA